MMTRIWMRSGIGASFRYDPLRVLKVIVPQMAESCKGASFRYDPLRVLKEPNVSLLRCSRNASFRYDPLRVLKVAIPTYHPSSWQALHSGTTR